MRTITTVLSIFLLAIPDALLAQRLPLPVGPGDRVLVMTRLDAGRLEGIVMEVDPNVLTIAVRGGDPREAVLPDSAGRIEAIPIATIRTLHLHQPIGASERARSAVGWGLLGAGGGALLGFVMAPVLFEPPHSGFEPIISGFYGLIAGGAIGAIYGAARPNPWQAVHVPNTEREQR